MQDVLEEFSSLWLDEIARDIGYCRVPKGSPRECAWKRGEEREVDELCNSHFEVWRGASPLEERL